MIRIRQKRKKFLAVLLSVACFMAMNFSILAAEPAVGTSYETRSVESTDFISTSDDDSGIMPLSINGYAAKYTNPMKGSFTVSTSGSSNSTGTFQITTHDFSGSPAIVVVLTRPDGTYATEFSITGNGTKSKTFSNAIAGDYKITYTVDGVNAGWISAWVSS